MVKGQSVPFPPATIACIVILYYVLLNIIMNNSITLDLLPINLFVKL